MIINKWDNTEFNIDIKKDNNLNKTDSKYHKLLIKILKTGVWKENRTGTKTLSIFGEKIKFKNVGEHFPLLTTKNIHIKSIIGELLWFLSGSTDKNELKNKYGVSIWDEWNAPNPKFDGDMGPIYGSQWVNWTYYDESNNLEKKTINQIQNIIDSLKTNPDDRRMIVSAWKVDDIKNMALPPCHWSFQFYSVLYPGNEKRTLHLIENQRSVDTFLGLPFNIASYALLLLMVAKEVDMIPGDLTMNLGDTHIYENHIPYICEQLNRSSKSFEPIMQLHNKTFWNAEIKDFELLNYLSHPNWKNIPVAV